MLFRGRAFEREISRLHPRAIGRVASDELAHQEHWEPMGAGPMGLGDGVVPAFVVVVVG